MPEVMTRTLYEYLEGHFKVIEEFLKEKNQEENFFEIAIFSLDSLRLNPTFQALTETMTALELPNVPNDVLVLAFLETRKALEEEGLKLGNISFETCDDEEIGYEFKETKH